MLEHETKFIYMQIFIDALSVISLLFFARAIYESLTVYKKSNGSVPFWRILFDIDKEEDSPFDVLCVSILFACTAGSLILSTN